VALSGAIFRCAPAIWVKVKIEISDYAFLRKRSDSRTDLLNLEKRMYKNDSKFWQETNNFDKSASFSFCNSDFLDDFGFIFERRTHLQNDCVNWQFSPKSREWQVRQDTSTQDKKYTSIKSPLPLSDWIRSYSYLIPTLQSPLRKLKLTQVAKNRFATDATDLRKFKYRCPKIGILTTYYLIKDV
jgi:hypothetical protein